MANPTTPNIASLKRAIEIAESIEKLQAELAALISGKSAAASPTLPKAAPTATVAPKGRRGGKRQLSPEARERIAAAQRARWSKSRTAAKPAATAVPAPKKAGKTAPKKRVLTSAGREKLSSALKARWAARKKGGPAPNQRKK